MNDINYRIEAAKDGNPTLVIEKQGRDILFHSRISPLKEGDAATYSPEPGKYDLLILLGCGLGYYYTSLKDYCEKYRLIIIIDFLKHIENEIVNISHTSFLVTGPNIRFFSGISIENISKKLSEVIDFQEIKGIQVIEHPQSIRIFSDFYNDAATVIKKFIDKKAADRATVRAFGSLFLRNALNNLDNFRYCLPLSVLAGKFSGRKAVIVSSAPSLEDYIKNLKSSEKSVYIIAVDSVLPVLNCYGIKPDFVISIDPQPRIGEHFLGHETDSAMHIFSVVSPPELVYKYKGFISGNSHPVSQVIQNLYPDRISSIDSATGSVAGDAFNFAVFAGFDYIAMTGFDFSFSGNIIYARETAYQKRYSLYFSNRFRTAETFNAQYIFRSSGSLVVEGRYTRRSFIGYRDSLDALIKEKNSANVFIINKRGLALINADDMDFDTFISIPVSASEKKSEYLQEINSKRYSFSFNMHKIRDTLLDRKVFSEIIRESLGTDCTENRKVKLLSVIKRSAG